MEYINKQDEIFSFKIKDMCLNLSVLLVDDEEASMNQVYNILTLFFSVVYKAKDGEEAFEIYKHNRPDIIITDLTMPKVCGFELIELVRSIYQKQKIIVMSAHTETEVIVKAIKIGVDGYILKPIEANQMFESLEKTVSNLKIENENEAYQDGLKNRVDTQAKQLLNQLEHDSLTGLPNKEKLNLDFKSISFDEVILLDIDNFSHINSTYGYKEGDMLLKSIAEFLYSIVGDALYKGSGDEFFIALKSSSPEESLSLAEDIKHKIYSKRFDINGALVRITFSMGIVTISFGETELPYSKAQLAISDMRKLHKNVIGHYHKNSKSESYHQKMHEWTNKVKLALDFDLLVPYYQPIINISTGEVQKYECLARIIEADKVISPFYFIEPARTAGMVTDITRRMILKAFETFSNSLKEFSINITDDDFKEEYLIEYLREHCEKFNISPSRVVLEVLENISDYDAEHAVKQMDELKQMGFKIAIDDFGAKSSNFVRVQKLDVDYLKIDGGFIKDIAQNQNSMIIVKTIVFYAKNANLKTIAEYVHDKETYEVVKGLGIDYVQGYFFYEPLKEIL